MTFDPAAMLRQLGQSGAVRGPGTPSPRTPGVPDGEFSSLLRQAREGMLSSNRPISVQSGAGVELTDDQLARLSLAADRAEAAGLRRALVTIDDQRFILDVQLRTIIGPATGEDGVLDNIDGVIDLAGALVSPESTAPPVEPPTALESPAVARLLAKALERGRAA